MTRFLNRFALLALMGAVGCETSVAKLLPSLDPSQATFNFPTGLAVQTLPSGKTSLLVVSSNFDLRYDPGSGGTLLAVDPDASQNSLSTCKADCGSALAILGATRMGSFGGEVNYADPTLKQDPINQNPHACGQLGDLRPNALTRVVTVSRSENKAYWMTMDAQGQLGCDGKSGVACAIPLVNPNPLQQNRQLGDAYGVTIACSDTGGTPSKANGETARQASVFITHLLATNDQGWVSEVPLYSSRDCSVSGDPCSADTPPVAPNGSSPGDLRFQDLGPISDTYATAYDAAIGRLYATSRVVTLGSTPLRWFDYATPMLTPQPPMPAVPTRTVGQFNFDQLIRGSVARSFALSHDGTRGYLAVELYDTTFAANTGDISTVYASQLAVLDLRPGPSGAPSFRVLKTISIPAGPIQVKVLPQRKGKLDLVAVTCTDDGALVLYDDNLDGSEPTAIIALDQKTGKPVLGRQPYGLAVEAAARPQSDCHLTGAASCDRLYVGSFDRGWVNVIEVDPESPTNGWNNCSAEDDCPALVRRIGRERQ